MAWQLNKFHSAPVGAKRIVVCDDNDNRRSIVRLGGLKPPDRSKRLYSFGLLSDLHLSKTDANAAQNTVFSDTIDYFDKDKEIEFICITGDVVHENNASRDYTVFAQNFHAEKDAEGFLVTKTNRKRCYPITGNHDWMFNNKADTRDATKDALGIGIYHIAEHHNDVFVFLGTYTIVESGALYSTQYFLGKDLREIDGAVRMAREGGKRTFFFRHTPVYEDLPDYVIDDSTTTKYLPKSFFKNSTVFYGHTHKNLLMNTASHREMCREDTMGFHGVFVPALCGSDADPGHGYIVDVYEDGIHLRGVDFANNQEAIPTGTYWIDTESE